MEKVIQLWSQHHTAFAIGAAVVLVSALLVVVRLVIRARSRKDGEKIDRKLADDLAKGNYEGAAERELEVGHLSAAYDLFLRARRPVRAAHIAVRQGRLQEAAELFEEAGSRKRAADLYNQAGMKLKAEELLAEEERVAREREDQKAALRKRLEAEPEEEVASLDQSPSPAKPAPRAPDLGDVAAPPPSVEPSWDEAKPVVEELSFGDAKPAAEELPSGGAKPAEAEILVDGPPPTPEPPAAIVEGLPEAAPRAARTTPRTPLPVVGPSIGVYRMVRPSEPEVFTPPPSLRPNSVEGAKSRLAQWPRPASGEHPSGEQRLPTPTPRLWLGTKLGMGESPPRGTRTPAGSTPPPPDETVSRPATPPPVPRASPQDTVPGIGPGRPGK